MRTRHGLSQREFAELLGIDIDTLQNWEQGRNRPDPAALNLVMAFDKSPELIAQAYVGACRLNRYDSLRGTVSDQLL